MIYRKHPLCTLADEIDWRVFEEELGTFYVEKVGGPWLPIRLVVGLHYLKYNFLENPYGQYFCGHEYFQHKFPLDPSSLVRWRNRVGAEGLGKLLKETIESAKRKELVREKRS